MERDIELIRTILNAAAASPSKLEGLEGVAPEIFAYHVALLIDAGYAEGITRKGTSGNIAAGVLLRLTWAGHEFRDAAKDPGVWEAVKGKVLATAGSVGVGVLLELLKAEGKKRFGLS